MKRFVVAVALVAVLAGMAWAQQTPSTLATSYSSLADAILALKQAEADLVRSILDHHMRAAEAAMMRGDFAAASAEIALFGSEGDNAIGGVRKRLVDSGHHHHAGGQSDDLYEPGYVIVTIEAKQEILAASAAMRRATDVGEREDAWYQFRQAAEGLLR